MKTPTASPSCVHHYLIPKRAGQLIDFGQCRLCGDQKPFLVWALDELEPSQRRELNQRIPLLGIDSRV